MDSEPKLDVQYFSKVLKIHKSDLKLFTCLNSIKTPTNVSKTQLTFNAFC